MSQSKVKSGSIKGAGDRVAPYDAMVYQDGTYTIAVDGDGNIIKKVLSSLNTDDVVIQAAIDGVTAGTVIVMYSTYTIDTMITIEDNVKLVFDHNTIVKPATDIDMFYVKNGSRISGCKIDVSGVVGYSSSCILINGSEKISSQTGTKNSVQIENIWFYNNVRTGNAIFFDSEDAISGSIYGVIVDKIRIYKFEYGIRFYRMGVSGLNWINGNTFSNIRASETPKLIYMESDTGVGSDLDGNMFTNIDMQSGGAPMIPAISIHGRYNILQNVMIWDWDVAWGPMFEFAANSNLNYVELDTSDASKYINNGSTSNTAFFTMSAEFNGLPKAPTAARGTNTTQIATTEYVMDSIVVTGEVTGTSQACEVNTGYILNNAALVTATLPATASVGDVIRIIGKGSGMWKLAQNASQYIRFAGLTTTTGTGGYLQAETAYDCIEIMCTTANNGWTVISSIGNILVV